MQAITVILSAIAALSLIALASQPSCVSTIQPSLPSIIDGLPELSAFSLLQVGADLKSDDAHAHTHTDTSNYMPRESLLVCSCAKCGSSSLYSFLWDEAFGEPWTYLTPPWIQFPSSRWKGRLVPSSIMPNVIKDPATFSYALFRDPKERLISSWKSKVACDGDRWETDTNARKGMVLELMELAGEDNLSSCLSFARYLEMLSIIHGNGDEGKLNIHFQPQHFGCFKDRPINTWNQTAQVSDPDAAWRLAERFGDASKPVFPRLHSSKKSSVLSISEHLDAQLNNITRIEYEHLRMKPSTKLYPYDA